MPNPDEAREEAWRAWWELVVGDDEPGEDTHDPHFNFMGGWDAAKREDEQRIAELERELAAANTLLKTTLALRALGQSEEVENG